MSLRKTYALALLSLAVLALGLAACGGAPAEEQGGQVSEGSGLPPGAEVTAPAPAVPGLSGLEAERLVVAPGETAVFRGDAALQGSLTLRGPAGLELSSAFEDGRGQVTIPEDAEEGRYVALLEARDGAIATGEVFVVAPPGIWLEADLLRPAPLDLVTLRVVANGVPDTAWAFVGLGDVDWASELSLDDEDVFSGDEEDGFFDEGSGLDAGLPDEEVPRAFLVPRDDGVLTPTLQPESQLGALTRGELVLFGVMADAVQVVASSAEDGDLILSNRVDLRACESLGTVTGQVRGDWAIRTLYLGSEGVEIADQIVENGPFVQEIPAGRVTVVGVPLDLPSSDDQPIAETRAVRAFLPCGGSIEVDLEAGTFQVTDHGEEVEEASPVGGEEESLATVGQVNLRGTLQGTYMVEAFCQQKAEGLKVLFSSSEWGEVSGMTLLLDGEPGSGVGSGTVRVYDAAFQKSEGPVEAELTLIPGDFLQGLRVRFSGTYAGEAGAGEVEGEFQCTIIGGSGTGKVPGLAMLRGRGPDALVTRSGGGGGTCRRVYVHVLRFGRTVRSVGVEDQFAARLSAALPRVKAFGPGVAREMAAMSGGSTPGADFDVFGVSGKELTQYQAFATARDKGRDQSVDVTTAPFSGDLSIAQAIANVVPLKLAEALIDAAICAEADPTSLQVDIQDEEDITVRVTNLGNAPVDGAEVKVYPSGQSCGEFDPRDGDTENGEFKTTYEAKRGPCNEPLAFGISWDGPQGPVQAKGSDTIVNIEVFGNLQMQDEYWFDKTSLDGAEFFMFGGVGYSLDVKACQTGPTGPWQGEIKIRLGALRSFVGLGAGLSRALGVGEDAAEQLLGATAGSEPGEEFTLPLQFTMPKEGGRFEFGVPGWVGWYFPEHRKVLLDTDHLTRVIKIVALPEGSPCP